MPPNARLVVTADRTPGTPRTADSEAVSAAALGVSMLPCSARVDEADRLLAEIATDPAAPSPSRRLLVRADLQETREIPEAALELSDQAIALGTTDPRDREWAREPFTRLAALLRTMGDPIGAVEIERKAAELPR